MAGGGGAVDHARHQRQRQVHGSNQARTRRSVIGQVVTGAEVGGGSTSIFPPAGRLAGRNGRVLWGPTSRREALLVPRHRRVRPPVRTRPASRTRRRSRPVVNGG